MLVRLALFALIATAAIIGFTTFIEVRLFERAVDTELSETGRLTAMMIADDVELREGMLVPEDVARHLHEFIDATPEIHGACVVATTAGGLTVFANTAPTPDADTLDTARRAIEARDVVWSARRGPIRSLAIPLNRDGRSWGAVVVAVSFAASERLRTTGRTAAIATTTVASFALFALIFLLGRVYLLRPIHTIQRTMGRAGSGDMSARVDILNRDELGAIAIGLNQMLSQVEDLHSSLQQRVDAATSELRARNADLVTLYRELFRLRQQMGQSEQMAAIGETAAVVAHQIGTPLNLVSGHIQVLLESHGDSSEVGRRLHIAQEQIQKVTSAVRGLLDRTRRSPSLDRMDLAALVRRISTLIEPAFEAAHVRVTVDCPQAVVVLGDELPFEMALLNLVSNALDAMPGGGTLAFQVQVSGGRVTLEVADSGGGIAPEVEDRIFEPWVTTKAAGHGTGLGLSIARSVIIEHGGTILARSVAGTGTTFVIDLPLAPAAEAAGDTHG